MKFLPAPWRWPFLTGLKKSETCFLCQAPAQNDRDSLICHRGGKFFVLLNRYPYTSGHLLVAPYEHVASPEAKEAADLGEMWDLALQGMRILRLRFHPQGFNLGLNVGTAAGAGVHDHFHLHVVPRWEGDANFMAVTGETRVISCDLETVRRTIADAYTQQQKVVTDDAAEKPHPRHE